MPPARKRFGQHFLHDRNIVECIIRAVDPRPGEQILERELGRITQERGATMNPWEKFKRYGDWSLAMGIIVALSMLIIAKFYGHTPEKIWIIVAIYNVLCAEMFLYWIFKPYQHYSKEIQYDEETAIYCQIDSLDDIGEEMITILLAITFALLGCHVIYFMVVCCCCCKKCCVKCCSDGRARLNSAPADRQVYRDWNYYVCLGYVFVGSFVFLMVICFAAVIIWALQVMIKEEREEFDTTKNVYIWVVIVFSFFSLWDIMVVKACRDDASLMLRGLCRSDSRQGIHTEYHTL